MNEGGSRATLQLTVNESAFFLSFILWMAFLTWNRARTLERATAALAQQLMEKKATAVPETQLGLCCLVHYHNPSPALDCE